MQYNKKTLIPDVSEMKTPGPTAAGRFGGSEVGPSSWVCAPEMYRELQ